MDTNSMTKNKLKQMYEEMATDNRHEHMKHSQHHRQQNHQQEPISSKYSVNLHFDSIVPESGTYKLWVDFKPKGGKQTLVTFIADVKGLPIHKTVMPAYDGIYVKESSDRNYQISLNLPQEKILAKRDTDIVFSISDASGNPITDLEPLMGAGGHSVIISSDIQEFLHVHPTEEVKPDWKGGLHITFGTSFPKLG